MYIYICCRKTIRTITPLDTFRFLSATVGWIQVLSFPTLDDNHQGLSCFSGGVKSTKNVVSRSVVSCCCCVTHLTIVPITIYKVHRCIYPLSIYIT